MGNNSVTDSDVTGITINNYLTVEIVNESECIAVVFSLGNDVTPDFSLDFGMNAADNESGNSTKEIFTMVYQSKFTFR